MSRHLIATGLIGAALLTAAFAVVAATWLGPRLGMPALLWSAPIETVTVDGRSLRVLLVGANTNGFRGVSSIGDVEGMLFGVLDRAPTLGMDDVPIPLDVAFFDDEGRLIEVLRMPVCEQTPCPGFAPAGAFKYALEAPADSLDWISKGARLTP